VVGNGPLHRLADPPGRVGRELVPAAPVELLDRAVEAERALLDQVEERHAEAAVALGDRHDQAEVRLDHAALGGAVAALDALGEHDLFRGGQKLVAADVREEELEAVGGAGELGKLDRSGLGGLLGDGLAGLLLAHLEADALELAPQLLEIDVGELVLERECLELGRLDVSTLFGPFDQQTCTIGLK
jgi:hypothetical protein